MIVLSIASSAWQRTTGLLFRSRLTPGEGLWIEHCHAIHTIGMRYPIGVYFLDQKRKVIRVQTRLEPMRFAWCSGADSVIETLPVEAASLARSVQLIEALLSESPALFDSNTER